MLTQVGRVEDLLHELVDRESIKPGPSSSHSSSAYVHAFSKLPLDLHMTVLLPVHKFDHNHSACMCGSM